MSDKIFCYQINLHLRIFCNTYFVLSGAEIDNIEAHIAESHRTVDEGTSLLGKAERYQKTRRKRLCCLSVTFIIVLLTIIITVIIVQKTK